MKLNFEFDSSSRDNWSLEQINRVLRTMKLDDLRVENVTFHDDPIPITDLLERAYEALKMPMTEVQPKTISLICKQANSAYGHILQIAAVSSRIDEADFGDIWCKYHPGRIIVNIHKVEEQGKQNKYVVIHRVHAKDDSGKDYSDELAAKPTDWKTTPMPAKNSQFILKEPLTPEQRWTLSFGHIPSFEDPLDHWFTYMDGNTLYAFRKNTGYCVYVIEISESDDAHLVTVNRNPNQHRAGSDAAECEILRDFLRHWSNADLKSRLDPDGESISAKISAAAFQGMKEKE